MPGDEETPTFVARGAQIVQKTRHASGLGAAGALLVGAFFTAAAYDHPLSRWSGLMLVVVASMVLGGAALGLVTQLRTHWSYGTGEIAIGAGMLRIRKGTMERAIALSRVTRMVEKASDRLDVELEGGETIALQLRNAGERAEACAALQAGRAKKPTVDIPLYEAGYRTGRIALGGFLGFVLGSAVGPLLAALPGFVLPRGGLRTAIGVSLVVVGQLASIISSVLLATRILRRVSIGRDGIAFRRGLRGEPIFVSFARVVETSTDVASLGGKLRGRSLTLRLHDGTRCEIGAGTDARVESVAADIEEARRAWEVRARATQRLDAIEPEGAAAKEWLAALRKQAAADATYRDATIPYDRLADLVDDPAATPAQRIGAAVVLRARDESDARDRIRVAAADTASPRVRIALEAIARDADGAVLEEHLAAVLEEDRAQRRVAAAP